MTVSQPRLGEQPLLPPQNPHSAITQVPRELVESPALEIWKSPLGSRLEVALLERGLATMTPEVHPQPGCALAELGLG